MTVSARIPSVTSNRSKKFRCEEQANHGVACILNAGDRDAYIAITIPVVVEHTRLDPPCAEGRIMSTVACAEGAAGNFSHGITFGHWGASGVNL
jgi:hypothetical protein